MRCAQCGSDNPEGAKFCIECAAPFTRRCPGCGTENPPQAKFCAECATPLTVEVPTPKAQLPRLEESGVQKGLESRSRGLESRQDGAERRQLTVMFCDLVGSTALSTQLDPEELREVVRAYQGLCATMISRFEGHLAKYIGDGLLVYFGYPAAHEDDAQRAVRAGLGIAGAIPDLPLPPNVRLRQPLQVRIGIHTGLVVAGEMGTVEQPEPLAIVGETPNIAARLQERALPNSVVISPTTYRLVTGLFECQELGPHELKGL